jgi:hypothetical protein
MRRTVTNLLTRLAPIVASRSIKLEGLDDAELRSLLLALQHIEQRISRAERKAKQPQTSNLGVGSRYPLTGKCLRAKIKEQRRGRQNVSKD